MTPQRRWAAAGLLALLLAVGTCGYVARDVLALETPPVIASASGGGTAGLGAASFGLDSLTVVDSLATEEGKPIPAPPGARFVRAVLRQSFEPGARLEDYSCGMTLLDTATGREWRAGEHQALVSADHRAGARGCTPSTEEQRRLVPGQQRRILLLFAVPEGAAPTLALKVERERPPQAILLRP